MTQVNRREQVKELIEKGNMTKAEIAEALEVNPASVSSQMTYLRWMGNFIIADPETKALSFCTEEENEAHQTLVKASRKSKASAASKDPQDVANALAKTLKTQRAQYTKALVKCAQVDADVQLEPDDMELIELKEEADANATLLRIKIKRNEARAENLPEPVEVEDEVVEPETDDDELL